jgi:hypothetical protein
MFIVATAPNGINTTNMFANTNINFSDLILWDPSVPCNNCEGLERLKVTNDKQNNGSKKMLQAKMIKQRKTISYQNTSKQNAYNIIYSHIFYDNVNLISKYNSQYYVNLIQVLLRSNNVSGDRKEKIREFISRIII